MGAVLRRGSGTRESARPEQPKNAIIFCSRWKEDANAASGESRMARGTVKWFNDSKGFGFIEQEGGGEDVFVHHTSIIADGYRSLKEGQAVEFEVTNENKGLRAQNVSVAN
jgi:CspA family cold shock protein